MTSLHVAPLRGLDAPSPTTATILTGGGLGAASVAARSFVSTTALAARAAGEGAPARRRLGLQELGAPRRRNVGGGDGAAAGQAGRRRRPALKLAISRDILRCPEKNERTWRDYTNQRLELLFLMVIFNGCKIFPH
ncbi:hypothetical protein EUGRSUZ_L03195 [Eucalyptus grandis]|uniref:Uncharacterized protein n=1 Tax=Eucalyptus grandis TaxID=71139 RepID=A0AAD9T8J7_EUCGR|nr:hypothetical protein EUGRSUZ_L03195 [Eucalyptus grandis]